MIQKETTAVHQAGKGSAGVRPGVLGPEELWLVPGRGLGGTQGVCAGEKGGVPRVWIGESWRRILNGLAGGKSGGIGKLRRGEEREEKNKQRGIS